MINAETLKRGGKYNWKNQKERLIYMGSKQHNGDRRRWHQFALVEAPSIVWAEVLDCDLDYFEESK